LLKELKVFSEYYRHFWRFDCTSFPINEALKRLDKLQVTVCYPFLLELFGTWDNGIIGESDLVRVLNTLEAFIFRRIICDVPTNSLNKIFAALGKNIRKKEEFETQYLDIFNYLLASGVSSNRFPQDKEFKKDLVHRDIYHLKGKNKIHLLERLENHNNREKVNVEGLIEQKKDGLTIEHIMPQRLNSKWKSDLGDNWQKTHDDYLHTLGNITLTAYNSTLSNSCFEDKVNKDKGFKESRLWLNKFLVGQKEWTRNTIKERAENLAKRCLDIWAYPEVKYTPLEEEERIIGLDDDFIVTGETPKNFTFLDQVYEANSWRDLCKKTIEILNDLDPVTFDSLIKRNKHGSFLSIEEKKFRTSFDVSGKIYVNLNLSAKSITNYIKSLFDDFDLDRTDYTITLR